VAKAMVDPAELRRFANHLKQFSNEVKNQVGALRGQFLHLGTSWRDQENQKFAEEFERTFQAIGRFIEAANEHIPFLLRKAERVEEYLQQR